MLFSRKGSRVGKAEPVPQEETHEDSYYDEEIDIDYELDGEEGSEFDEAAEEVQDAVDTEEKRDMRAEVYDWLQCVVSALLFCVIMFVFFARMIGVIGTSMVPTLQDEDKIFISNLFYTPKQGDVVVFRKESFRYDPLVKRIIATAGQTLDIDFERGIVSVDGVELQEDYIKDLTTRRLNFSGPVTVPEGYVFVMGDNRDNSTDSRDTRIGLVDERLIMGKVYFVVLPFSNFGTV